MSRRTTRRVGWALGVLLLAAPANATGRPPDEGLDLVLLVDRSRSMASAPYDVRDLLLSLAGGLAAWSSEANRVRHRLAVVSFGSRPRVDLPLSDVMSKAGVRRAIDAVRWPASLGRTDFLSAFRAAEAVFARSPETRQGKRAILLVTDGVPYGPDLDPGEHLEDLRRLVAADPDITTEVVLTASMLPARERYRRLWMSIAPGRVHELSGRRSDALAVLHRAVTGLFGTRVVESRKVGAERAVVVLPAYLDLVVFDVLAASPQADVQVLPPGSPHRPLVLGAPGVEEIRLGPLMRTVVVRRPSPGRWTFVKSHAEARVRILSQQFFPRGLLVEPDGGRAVRQHARVVPAYRLIDRDGSPLRELPGHPLFLRLSLRRPDGERSLLLMQRQAEAPGTFGAMRETDCDLPGRYWTEAEVVTRVENRQVEVFRDHWSGFMVHRASRIDCRVLMPRQRELVFSDSLIDRRVKTRLECRDSAERPVDLEAIANGSAARVFVPVLSRRGRRIAATLDLAAAGPGVLEGSLRGAALPGPYRLELTIDAMRLPIGYTIRLLPSATTFTRGLSSRDGLKLGLLSVALVLPLAGVSRLCSRRRGRHDRPRATRFLNGPGLGARFLRDPALSADLAAPPAPELSAGIFIGEQFSYDSSLSDVRYAINDAIDPAHTLNGTSTCCSPRTRCWNSRQGLRPSGCCRRRRRSRARCAF